jgi:hypothetical protein
MSTTKGMRKYCESTCTLNVRKLVESLNKPLLFSVFYVKMYLAEKGQEGGTQGCFRAVTLLCSIL